jgi:UDP-2,3-diacylglucosamine hydrolase
MQSVKASVLAVEAGASVLLDREEMLRKADRAGIAVVGIAAEEGK